MQGRDLGYYQQNLNLFKINKKPQLPIKPMLIILKNAIIKENLPLIQTRFKNRSKAEAKLMIKVHLEKLKVIVN